MGTTANVLVVLRSGCEAHADSRAVSVAWIKYERLRSQAAQMSQHRPVGWADIGEVASCLHHR